MHLEPRNKIKDFSEVYTPPKIPLRKATNDASAGNLLTCVELPPEHKIMEVCFHLLECCSLLLNYQVVEI